MIVHVKYGRRYPWVKWFSKRSFRLLAGRDYDCRTYTMAQMVRNTASRLRYKVSVTVYPDESGLSVKVRKD